MSENNSSVESHHCAVNYRQFDIVIIGGGMIGLSLAVGLANEGFSIAIIDQSQLPSSKVTEDTIPDIRVSSLSLGTAQFLESISVWPELIKRRITPYAKLSTWDSHFPSVNFDSNQLGKTQLGYMIENSILHSTLLSICLNKINISYFDNSTVLDIQKVSSHSQSIVTFLNSENSSNSIKAKLIVGSDGANSCVRKLAHIGSSGWQYHQACMLITVKTDSTEKDITWQQFNPSGPRAYLPLHDNWASLIWYDDKTKLKQLMSLPEPQFNQAVAEAFPSRIGNIEIINKAMFPLTRMHANTYWKPGIVLVGDAAHTINPLAGQGANLGFKDIELLMKLIVEANRTGTDWHSNELLAHYTQCRYKDNLLMQTAMDGFYFTFANQSLPFKLLRNALFMAVEHNQLLKKFILKYAIGLEDVSVR